MNKMRPCGYCGRAAAIALLIFLVFQMGCGSRGDFAESLDADAARARLLGFLPLPNADLRVLHYRKDTQRDAEYWVLLTEAAPDLNALRDASGPTTCPADSIFQFAASCKVDEDLLEPASNSASNTASDSQQGRLWQWSQDEQQWRLRSVQGARGVLSVVERTP